MNIEEFLQLCYQYWEGSWEDDAIQKDKIRRIFTDPSKVHEIQHQGRFYQSQGVFQVAPSMQRTPVLFQAGASPRGLAFATAHAECIFIGGDQPEKIRQQVDKIREFAVQQTAKPVTLKFFWALPWSLEKQNKSLRRNWQSIVNTPAQKRDLRIMPVQSAWIYPNLQMMK